MKRRLYGEVQGCDHGANNRHHDSNLARDAVQFVVEVFVFGEEILDVLVFAEEPDFAADIILRLEEAGDFNVYPINGGSLAGEMQIPSGDVVVVAAPTDVEMTEEILGRLEQIGVPTVRLSETGKPDANHLAALSAHGDVAALTQLLGILDSDRKTGRYETGVGLRPAPAERDEAVDKP